MKKVQKLFVFFTKQKKEITEVISCAPSWA